MKKILIILLCVLILTGCKAKTMDEVSPKKFKEIMDAEKIDVYNVSDSYDFATKAYYVDNKMYKITYIKGDDSTTMNGLYIDEVKNSLSKAGNEPTRTTVGGKNYNYTEIIGEGKYFYNAVIEDAMLILECDSKYKKDARKLLKELEFMQ